MNAERSGSMKFITAKKLVKNGEFLVDGYSFYVSKAESKEHIDSDGRGLFTMTRKNPLTVG